MGVNAPGTHDVEEGEIIQAGEVQQSKQLEKESSEISKMGIQEISRADVGQTSEPKKNLRETKDARSEEGEIQPRVYASAKARKVVARKQKLNLLRSQQFKDRLSNNESHRGGDGDWQRASFRESHSSLRARRWKQDRRIFEDRNVSYGPRRTRYNRDEPHPLSQPREPHDHHHRHHPRDSFYDDRNQMTDQSTYQGHPNSYSDVRTSDRPFSIPLPTRLMSPHHQQPSSQALAPIPNEQQYPPSDQYPPRLSDHQHPPHYLYNSSHPQQMPLAHDHNIQCNSDVIHYPTLIHHPPSPPPTAPIHDDIPQHHQCQHILELDKHYQHPPFQKPCEIPFDPFMQSNPLLPQMIVENEPLGLYPGSNPEDLLHSESTPESGSAGGATSNRYTFQCSPIDSYHTPSAENLTNSCSENQRPCSNYESTIPNPGYLYSNQDPSRALPEVDQACFNSEFQPFHQCQTNSNPMSDLAGGVFDNHNHFMNKFTEDSNCDVRKACQNEENLGCFNELEAKNEARRILIRLVSWGVTAEYLMGRGVSKDLVVMIFDELGFKLPKSLAPNKSRSGRHRRRIDDSEYRVKDEQSDKKRSKGTSIKLSSEERRHQSREKRMSDLGRNSVEIIRSEIKQAKLISGTRSNDKFREGSERKKRNYSYEYQPKRKSHAVDGEVRQMRKFSDSSSMRSVDDLSGRYQDDNRRRNHRIESVASEPVEELTWRMGRELDSRDYFIQTKDAPSHRKISEGSRAIGREPMPDWLIDGYEERRTMNDVISKKWKNEEEGESKGLKVENFRASESSKYGNYNGLRRSLRRKS
ncbi:expressed protein [Phakopsora pachyrhizi]|uniref:Expressed protein n=1 Tax=Phakopsora pachyrhizi TaxID=170000 RepID=A0AAV0AFU1_PHAPC|nr:expressed protein [Phakopsora pachyrhizi]